MKLLFNETHEAEDTKVEFFWYQTGIKEVSEITNIIDEIVSIVEKDCVIETQYYFYTEMVNGDAIGDKVRTTIMLRKKLDGEYDINMNISDFQMAMHMDEINIYKSKLDSMLNK